MWKILTTQIKEEIYFSLTSRGLFRKNRKITTKDPEAQETTLHLSRDLPLRGEK